MDLGIIDGKRVILLDGEARDLPWKDALAWARSRGGDLPTRAELEITTPELRKRLGIHVWSHWTNEEASADEAWGRNFDMGYKGTFRKDWKLRARAVRREQA